MQECADSIVGGDGGDGGDADAGRESVVHGSW